LKLILKPIKPQTTFAVSKGKSDYCEKRAEQIIGREAKTATFIKQFFFARSLRVARFCPRQFNRSVLACTLCFAQIKLA